MKNLRNRVDERLVSNQKDYLKRTPKPSYVEQIIFDNNLIANHKIKTSSTLNKQAHVGVCILKLSIAPIYEFHYDYIKKKYDKFFTDTDRLVYKIEAENVYDDFSKNKEMFDFSNYHNSKFYDALKALVG